MWPEHPVHAGGKVNWGHLAAADPSFGGTDGKYDLVEEFLPGPPPQASAYAAWWGPWPFRVSTRSIRYAPHLGVLRTSCNG